MQQLLRIVEAGANGSDGAIHYFGYFMMAQAIDFKKRYHGAMLGRQLLHRIVQFFLKLMDERVPVGPGFIRERGDDFA